MTIARRRGRDEAALLRETRRALTASGGKPHEYENVHAHAGRVLMYGVQKAEFSAICRDFVQRVAAIDPRSALSLAADLLASQVYEEGHLGIAAIRCHKQEIGPDRFPLVDEAVNGLSSWSMTDDFTTGKAGVTSYWLERHERETLALLETWRNSALPLKRRAGVVTFTRATAANGRYVDEILAFCRNMQFDPEDLVQKGIGWALKDVMRAGAMAKRRGLALVKEMRRAGVPSTITLYALRDLGPAERKPIVAIKPRP